jgi:uncharacterized membrane protein YagU involved in acid resistance
MKVNIGRAAIAGIAGTLVMTAVGLWIAPVMGIPRMNPAEMLAGAMGGMIALGWVAHFMIGTILAIIYAMVADKIPGPPAARGALYGVAPFLVAQTVVMPMMGMPLFSGSATMAMGSLIGHLIYGGVVGAVYGPVPAGVDARSDARHSLAAH